MGILTTGPAIKNHITPKMARGLIAILKTMYHSWSLVCRRVTLLHLHLILQHLHHRILYSPFCSLRFCTVGQVTLADNSGHLSARFCVMRRKRRRLLDLSMRVTVYNPLTASYYWRMAAFLTELRHDAVIALPGTQKRVAVAAPPCQSHKFTGAWGLSWGFRHGAYESNRSAGVSLLF